MREALRNPTEVLKNLMEKSKNETYRFQRLYRNLYNPEFYWLAYKNIYANDGSMTAGADGTTIDGMGNERIERIILSLKDRSYHPKPARREYIAKKIPDTRDVPVNRPNCQKFEQFLFIKCIYFFKILFTIIC